MSSSDSDNDEELNSLLATIEITPRTRHHILYGDNNTEEVHNSALQEARQEHRRIRENALKAFRKHELREQERKLKEQKKREEERLRAEEDRARAAEEVNRLKAKSIQIPEPTPLPHPPSQEPVPTVPPPQAVPTPTPAPAEASKSLPAQPTADVLPPAPKPVEPPAKEPEPPKPLPVQTPPPAPVVQSQPPKAPEPAPIPQPVPAPQLPQAQPKPQYKLLPGADEYLEIHKRLKNLRKFMADHGKQDVQFKKKMGEMRREIRKSVGQLTEGKGANKIPTDKICAVLKEALTNMPSPPVDPGMVLLKKPEPAPGAVNNGEQLPSLFIYLLNVFAKAIISQFIDEAGVSPRAADPIGVAAVSVFARLDNCWRGESMIDILMAKFRAVCPVLWGSRGSEKTEEGRARLGWKRSEGVWVTDQQHNTRMTGLGAGYASIALRDFSKTRLKNPYPPPKYWMTVAAIVGTPPADASSTHYIVLRALIENFEQRFMMLYGSAGRAAIQVAVVDFPARAVETNAAVTSLKVLGDKLTRDNGLRLRPAKPAPVAVGGGGFGAWGR